MFPNETPDKSNPAGRELYTVLCLIDIHMLCWDMLNNLLTFEININHDVLIALFKTMLRKMNFCDFLKVQIMFKFK